MIGHLELHTQLAAVVQVRLHVEVKAFGADHDPFVNGDDPRWLRIQSELNRKLMFSNLRCVA
jgi:hypothetical protein